MNLNQLQRKLLSAGRCAVPSDRVPFAFEKRIMAQLHGVPQFDRWAAWAAGLWRAAALCIAVMLLLSAWAWFRPAKPSGNNDLAQELENTMLAVADQEQQPPSGSLQ